MHIYFSGIGGVGIGPLAMLALDAGFSVSGSDMAESEMTQLLRGRGVEISTVQNTDSIAKAHADSPIDWFVHSAAVKDDNPELVFANTHNIKASKRADFLNMLLKKLGLKMIAVAGTHGKTTTTGMLIWLFKQLKVPCSYSIGTTISFGPPAQYVEGSKYFIYECDEFDRNFLRFRPYQSLITSLDYDHPDTYKTPEDYVTAFNQFVAQSGTAITWAAIANKLETNTNTFVLPNDRNFDLVTLAGLHNRQNAWLAATAVNKLGLVSDTAEDWQKLLNTVSDFPGTNRRFEKLAENLYTDYAHHPVEIAAIIQTAKEVNINVVVVYQPHQNERQIELYKTLAYASCFDGVKKLYWLPTYLSREDSSRTVLEVKELVSTVKTEDFTIEIADMNNELSEAIKQHRQNGDLVIGLSAGDLDSWLRKLQ